MAGEGRFEPGPQLERLIFFSDAVFAIALTLLVIDLRLPDLAGVTGGPSALDALRSAASGVMSFVLSFAVVGLYWTGHHRIFGVVRSLDGRLIALNFGLLLFVVFLPYPTSFLSAYGNDPVGAAFYALVNVGAGSFQASLWIYCARRGMLRAGLPARYIRYRTLYYLRASAVFLVSIPVAFAIGPSVAEFFWAALLPLGWLLRNVYADVAGLQPERT